MVYKMLHSLRMAFVLILLGSTASTAADPSKILEQTAAKLKQAALKWHADSIQNNGWPGNVDGKAIIKRGLSKGSTFEHCRFKKRVLKKLASGESFNILISGGSVTLGSNLCGCMTSHEYEFEHSCKCNSSYGYGYMERPWPWLFGGLLEGNHENIENGRKEVREKSLKVEAAWLRQGMNFTVDTDVTGGYSVTDVAKLLDGGKLLHLSDGAFRKMKTLTRRWMDRYDLIIMDHSVNDYQDFLHLDRNNKKEDGKAGLNANRVNQTFGMVISQLRALESAPALLFTQFEGLMSKGFASGETSEDGSYVGYTRSDGFDGKTGSCFDLRLPENQNRFVTPTWNDNCWSAPTWQAKKCNAEVNVHGVTGRNFCHYIDDGKHNIWCYHPSTWHIEDTTSPPIAERGVPYISMRDILWPDHDSPPRNVMQLWNGCEHPDGYAHNNMYGLTMFALAELFKDVAASTAAFSNGGGAGLECDALRSGADLVPHQKLCSDGIKQHIFAATPNRPTSNFQPVQSLPNEAAPSRWKYTADNKRGDKWGWILDEAEAANIFEASTLNPKASTTLNSLGFRLSFDLTKDADGQAGAGSNVPVTTVVVEFMKSYSPEWARVHVWFNDSPLPGAGKPGLEDVITLDAGWGKQSSLTRSVVIHAAAGKGNATKNEQSIFADWTYFLKLTTELKVIHIEPVSAELRAKDRFKFKLSGLRAC